MKVEMENTAHAKKTLVSESAARTVSSCSRLCALTLHRPDRITQIASGVVVASLVGGWNTLKSDYEDAPKRRDADWLQVELTLWSLKRRTSLKSLASRKIRSILVDRSTAFSPPATSTAYVHVLGNKTRYYKWFHDMRMQYIDILEDKKTLK